MNLGVAAGTGWREISANKFRSLLSFSAVSVGTASLLYTLAQTRGMQEALARNLELMGPGSMTIQAKEGYVSRGLSTGLTLADAEAIGREFPDLYMVNPLMQTRGVRLAYGRTLVEGLRVDGVTPQWRKRDWVYKQRGRFFNDWDVAHAARVCVVVEPGGWVKKPFWASFYMREDPFEAFVARRDLLGRQIRLKESLFTVVGVLELPPRDKDPRWESWNNPAVLVPVTAFHRFLKEGTAAADGVGHIKIDTGDERTLSPYRKRLEALLKRRHRGEEDFEIKDMREEIAGEMEEQRKYVLAAVALGIVALLAGGIGIMNVTLATIFSRVKEIGVRRAVGAGRADIMAQFVLEAGLLGAAGGLAGAGLGAVGISWLAKTAQRDVVSMAWHHCLAVIVLAAVVSALFAVIPAYQAALLDPVEALRSES